LSLVGPLFSVVISFSGIERFLVAWGMLCFEESAGVGICIFFGEVPILFKFSVLSQAFPTFFLFPPLENTGVEARAGASSAAMVICVNWVLIFYFSSLFVAPFSLDNSVAIFVPLPFAGATPVFAFFFCRRPFLYFLKSPRVALLLGME